MSEVATHGPGEGVGDQDKNQITAPHWLTPPVNQETWIGLLALSQSTAAMF